MPIYSVPPHLSQFAVAKGADGSSVVIALDETSRSFVIPCRDEAQARALRQRLADGDHDGTVQVDLLDDPANDGGEK